MLHAVTENIDHAPLADLALQAGQKFAPHRAVLIEFQGRSRFRLRGLQESPELREVHGVFAVVVVRVAANPPAAAVG
jgi:hypothetical protein